MAQMAPVTKSLFSQLSTRIANYLLVFLQTQCALTIVSLPIIVYWGLGVSAVAIMGNLLFAPVLMLFLLLCTLTFFATLCQIPHSYLDMSINLLTSSWQNALAFSNQRWIIHCAKPHIIILAMPIIALILALRHPAIRSTRRRLFAMGSIIAIFLCYCWGQQQYMLFMHPTKLLHEKLYAIVRTDNQLMIVDDGFCARKKSPDKVVDFQILPEIAKTYGSLNIAEYTISKPTYGSMKAAEQLCKKCSVTQVVLPYFSAPANKSAWHAYFDLKRTLEAKGIRLVRYNEKYLQWWRYKLRSWVAKEALLKIHS